MTFRAIDPTNGRLLWERPLSTPAEVDRTIAEAAEGAARWREVPLEERARLVRHLGALLRERIEPFAAMITAEMGKPIGQARAEVEKCAAACDYYAERAEGFLAPERVEEIPGTPPRRGYVVFEPLGVVLAIMPWNFPLWQLFRFAAPALMAGNAVLLKHAPNVPGCADAIEELFREVGAPRGLFSQLRLDNEGTEALIDRSEIRAVTLTGSTRAGRAVAARAGAALKRCVLELGGSDPYLVLSDADLDSTVEILVQSRLVNSGQSCVAAKRFIVVDSIHDEVVGRLLDRLARVQVGDPLDPLTEVGPMAREDLREGLHRQVLRSVEMGAHLHLGGELPSGPGWFYPPTLLTAVSPGMPAYEDELFGPVASVIRAGDEADAIRMANDSPYGLGAAVFTADLVRGEAIAVRDLEAGMAFVNDLVRSDLRLPFGGIKDSGYGRELGSYGLREFAQPKTIWVR